MEYKCHRCGKEAKFFTFRDSPFYNYPEYWKMPKHALDNGWLFVCKNCITIDMALAKLSGQKIILMDYIGPSYGYTSKPLEEWIASAK
jgi:hypothetical protein